MLFFLVRENLEIHENNAFSVEYSDAMVRDIDMNRSLFVKTPTIVEKKVLTFIFRIVDMLRVEIHRPDYCKNLETVENGEVDLSKITELMDQLWMSGI